MIAGLWRRTRIFGSKHSGVFDEVLQRAYMNFARLAPFCRASEFFA